MKTSEILGTILGLFLMIGVWYGFNLAVTLTYVVISIITVFFLLALAALPHINTVDLVKMKDDLTFHKFLVSWVMIAGWVYTLLQTDNTQLLYFFVGYQIIVYTFIIRLFTKQEEN